jgi:hypothetical protein
MVWIPSGANLLSGYLVLEVYVRLSGPLDSVRRDGSGESAGLCTCSIEWWVRVARLRVQLRQKNCAQCS